MQIAKLTISNFRGVREGAVRFDKHAALVGPNNCGKTTVIEALALLFGRDRMVRELTEHDFFGSNPQPLHRISLVATIIGFDADDPTQHLAWFREDRGIVKWWDPATGRLSAQRANAQCRLACQVGFAARFDRPSLEVETLRYFHDDDSIADVFAEEVTTPFPLQLVRDVGFFLVPASRTWDRTMSFGSELFRRVVAAGDGQPSESVIDERDRLREPEGKLEEDEHLEPIVARLNEELAGFFHSKPKLHLRVTATDSDGLLEAVVAHYRHDGAAIALPARRHGSGLLSLQHLLLLLQFGRMRSEAHQGFLMALEEPELHVPPSLQRRLIHRIQALSTQTFISTHSPMVAALANPLGVSILRNVDGVLTATPLLSAPLPAATPNQVRKLFQVNRVDTIAALMHEAVLIPEGRTDHEWLGLLAHAVDLRQGWGAAEECHFDSTVGVIPTHDAAVVMTVQAMVPLHQRVVALVDGDNEGIGYSNTLLQLGVPGLTILRWGQGQSIEDIIGWVCAADVVCLTHMGLDPAVADVAALVARLKSDNRQANGLKKDTSAYEAVANGIGASDACCARARTVLNAVADAAKGIATNHFQVDAQFPDVRVFHP